MLKERDNWVAEEDPHVAMVRIARDMSLWTKRYTTDEVATAWNYAEVLDLLKRIYRLNQHEKLEKAADDEAMEMVRKHMEWIRLCCNGSDPVPAYFWLKMVPLLREHIPDGDWLAEKISPIKLFMKPGSFLFGVDTPRDAELVWRNHLDGLRWAMEEVFPLDKKLRIEVWDNNMNVWGDDEAA